MSSRAELLQSLLFANDLLPTIEDVATLQYPLLSRLRPAAHTLPALPIPREFGDGDKECSAQMSLYGFLRKACLATISNSPHTFELL
ncbi:hypothetical protein HBI51_251610, partial [Parastagonospora nodorum]